MANLSQHGFGSSLLLLLQLLLAVVVASEQTSPEAAGGQQDLSELVGEPNHPEDDVLGLPLTEEDLAHNTTNAEIVDFQKDPITLAGLYEGDIVISSQSVLNDVQTGQFARLSAVSNPHLLWPNKEVPYVISSYFNQWERSVIARAMKQYHKRTCIRFVPRQRHHAGYLHILKGQGCSSEVGNQRRSQVVSLGVGCVHEGVIVHELMHAIGFWHEQSRNDRDRYVDIHWNNIPPHLRYNFNKMHGTMNLGVSYDYYSVMHYGNYAFTMYPRHPTITAKDRRIKLGQRNGFSQKDVKKINLLYKCVGTTTTTTTTKEGSSCKDHNRHCASWASQGYCHTNDYVKTYCKAACGTCGSK